MLICSLFPTPISQDPFYTFLCSFCVLEMEPHSLLVVFWMGFGTLKAPTELEYGGEKGKGNILPFLASVLLLWQFIPSQLYFLLSNLFSMGPALTELWKYPYHPSFLQA